MVRVDKDSNTGRDTRSKSFSEALINVFGGYPIGFVIGILILPPTVDWIREDPITANAVITLIFSAATFARVYLLRRVFERFGYDDNIIRLVLRLRKRLRNR